ncbi:MAG: hypothetical protein IJU19_06370 [Bacteroidales bacterium]|nr:hypothetical protein [Bacteroidales bacterium]
MLPYFPKKIANRGILLYLIVLAVVSLFFRRYAMSWEYMAMGIVWVGGFFFLSNYCGRKWKAITPKRLRRNLFWTAFGLRVAWAVFSYFYYIAKTGMPFEFNAADAAGYWADGAWLATQKWPMIRNYLFTSRNTVSDSGYLFYLTYLYKIIGPDILLTRIVKAALSAATVLLLYRLTARSIGEEVGRMAAVFACFMPNLIFYCGLHLKETEMIFLMVAFLERADYLLRSRKYNFITIALPALLAISLFFFRTVLGAAAVFAFATALLFMNQQTLGKHKRKVLIGWSALAVLTLAGGTITNEVQGYWEDRGENQTAKRDFQTARGNRWAKYATGSVMAPMMFVLPFPTMINVDEQYTQQMVHGGNFVRNFLGIFVLITLYSALFVKKNWRDLSLLGAFVIAYLGIISSSGFANSERFLLPGLPVLLIMAAYGVSLLNKKNYKFVRLWYWVVPVMAFAWAFFKLGSRGLF